MAISQVLLSNTFNEFRITVNEISNTVNDLTANVLSGDIVANTITVGEISSNLIPSTNLIYDLGSTSNRWNDLYLSGNTIYLGAAEISYDGAKITFSVGGSNILDTSNLNASNLNSGTIPDARFPATLPAANGVNLTFLNATNIGTGTLNADRLANSGVSAGSYGSANQIATFSVDAKGRVTSVANVDVIGGINFVYKDANYTASNKEGVLANTATGSWTLTLPASPSAGDQVVVADSGDNWGTNNLTVGRNSSTIEGLAQDLILDVSGASVDLIYDGFTWNVYAQLGGVAAFSNASNITTGTLDNARTTANSANGALTIVLRDGSGSFEANTITANTFIGDGSLLTGVSGGGGSGLFNTAINEAVGYELTDVMDTAYTAPSTADQRYIIHSIHITNIGAESADVTGQFSGTTYSSIDFANTVPVPVGSSVELLKKPKILQPNDLIQLQASANTTLHATITIEAADDDTYFGGGIDLTSNTNTDLYVATANAIIESVLLSNDESSDVDVLATVVWTDGADVIQGYLTYNLVVPNDATIEVLEQPKFLPNGHKIRVQANQPNRLEAIIAGKTV